MWARAYVSGHSVEAAEGAQVLDTRNAEIITAKMTSLGHRDFIHDGE